MSKYGFNENEIVKTVVDMVDKDGFHKEVVTYGKPEPEPEPEVAHIEVATHLSTNAVESEKSDATLLIINVGEDADVYVKPGSTDSDYELDIGDVLENPNGGSYLSANVVFSSIGAVLVVDEALTSGSTVYYQIYTVDSEYKVLDRAKALAEVT